MKILMLNYEFPPLGGGGGVASKKLAEGFIKLGHEVDYITTWFKGLPKQEVVDGINVYRVKVIGRRELPTASLISMISFPFLAYKTASKLCKKNKYDKLMTFFAIPTGPLGVWVAKKFRLKNTLTMYGGDVYDPTKKLSPHKNVILRNVVGYVVNNSDYLVTESTDLKERLIQYYNPNKRVRVIPLPYEEVKFKKINREKLGLNKDLFYLVSVGRLVKRKGFDFLIKSLAELNNKKVHALIIGEGPEKDNLMRLAKKLKVEKQVHFLGFLSNEKKFQYLSNSDVYVLSSVHEGFGIVIQEAMQVGLTIISTNNGGQTDLVKEGENGFLINFMDSKELNKKMRLLLNNNKLLKTFSDKNRDNIKNFDYVNISKRYLKIK